MLAEPATVTIRAISTLARAQSRRLNLSAQFSSIALLYYDYLLTLPDEIQYVWKGEWRLSTFLYFCCRYSLASNIIYLLSIAEDTGLNCDVGYTTCGVLSIIGHAGIIGFWCFRTTAIYKTRKYRKIITIFLSALGTSILILLLIRAPFNRCTGPVALKGIRAAISALMMTFEISASLLAGFRAWQVVQEDKKAWKNPKASLHYLMFSQGLLYVVPVFILSVSSLALNFEVPFQFSRALNAVKLPLLGLLTARFILQLRKWEHKKKTVVVFELPTIRSDSGIQADAAVVNCQPLASASPSSPGQRRESLRSGTTGASWTRIVSREWWATVLSAKKEANALEEYGADIGPRHGSWVRRLRRERLGAHAADTEHNE